MGLEEDRLVGETMRQLGQALATNCLVASKMKEWRGSAEKKSHDVVELHHQIGNLEGELQQSRRTQQEAKALLAEKSQEALGLSEEKVKLLDEVERLKEELVQKDEKLAKEKEASTNDVVNLYLVGFEDVVAQA